MTFPKTIDTIQPSHRVYRTETDFIIPLYSEYAEI